MFTNWRTGGWSNRRLAAALGVCLLSASLAGSLAGCSLLPEEPRREALPDVRPLRMDPKPVYTVKRGTLAVKATASGTLIAEKKEPLFFAEEGRRIAKLYVREGDAVRAGQPIAELDVADLLTQRLRKELEQLEAEEKLTLLLREASADSEAVEKARLQLELLRLERAQLESRLSGAKLHAPFDGVIASLDAEVGDAPAAFAPIGEIADPSRLVAAAALGAADRDLLAPGMKAEVRINRYGAVEATIRRLPDPREAVDPADPASGKVILELENPPEGLVEGMPLTVSAVKEERVDALLIPTAALREQNERRYVLARHEDGSVGEVTVEVGLVTTTEAEIVAGLEEGQQVIGP
ncbi:efflux RND transporter periplasmic adaptor subunit [Paenibacillus sp.]|uniref:efflux RND transporter periplasmic adaptor subunit n=1 Tax=Paenibacillus sp. TaxID=58172 RepID=UPI002D528A0D|nr:efflux RND transporter periplasmic adaptor subunit [Paenibacillus sp.]HZG84209.1 efflux RND transporter periplasmic adaptor subunit [Paenibacillus sp.]